MCGMEVVQRERSGMEFLSNATSGAVDLASSLFSGAGFGTVFGTIAGAVSKYFTARLRLKAQKEQWHHIRVMSRLQNDQDRFMAEQQLLQLEEIGRSTAFDSAIEAEGALSFSNASPWASNIRTVTRPFLTLLLWVMTGASAIVVIINPSTQASTLAVYIVHVIGEAAGAATGFWFGQRGSRS